MAGGRFMRKMRKAKDAGGPSPSAQGIQIPHEAVTDAPPPTATAEMAAGGEDVVRGNSNSQGLKPEGSARVRRTGRALARAGGVDQIMPSSAERTMETAQAIQDADPNAPPISPQPGLESHALGNLEGEPKTPGVRKFLSDLVRKNPDFRIPGQGALSNRPGESFNDFRLRALGSVRGIMQALAENPHQAIAVPKHSQVSKLIEAWLAKGAPDDLSVDPNVMTRDHAPKPGEVEKLAPGENGEWALEKFNPETARDLPKGAIYLIEHGETPSTAAKSMQVSAAQKSRAQIIAAIRKGDWKTAKKVAHQASAAGLSDAEIDSAIDEAIPTLEDARNLSPADLLTMASASNQNRRGELAPLLKRHFSDLSGLDPHSAGMLKAHLGRLGA